MRRSWLVVIALAAACAAEDAPRHAGARVLAHGPLRIEVMDPAAPDRYHRGTRFTPLAAVLRATIAGHEFLHGPLAHSPIDDHAGLASEFDLCIPGGPAEQLPPGWSTAAVGGGFLKIGVGVLQKGREPYHLFHHPALLLAAGTSATWAADGAAFRQSCAGVDGLAYALAADLTMSDDGLAVEWRLANTGTRAFATRQYSHNFLCFDGAPVGPGYELAFPHPITVDGAGPEQEVDARSVRFARTIPRWANLEIAWPQGVEPALLTLSHAALGMSATCAVSQPCARIAVHARAPYCAPEQFVAIALAPGEERTWTRTWRFAAPAASR